MTSQLRIAIPPAPTYFASISSHLKYSPTVFKLSPARMDITIPIPAVRASISSSSSTPPPSNHNLLSSTGIPSPANRYNKTPSIHQMGIRPPKQLAGSTRPQSAMTRYKDRSPTAASFSQTAHIESSAADALSIKHANGTGHSPLLLSVKRALPATPNMLNQIRVDKRKKKSIVCPCSCLVS